jgi:hypothetical protein
MHRAVVASYNRVFHDRWRDIDSYGVNYLLMHLILGDAANRFKAIRHDEYAKRHLFQHALAADEPEVIAEFVQLACSQYPSR